MISRTASYVTVRVVTAILSEANIRRKAVDAVGEIYGLMMEYI